MLSTLFIYAPALSIPRKQEENIDQWITYARLSDRSRAVQSKVDQSPSPSPWGQTVVPANYLELQLLVPAAVLLMTKRTLSIALASFHSGGGVSLLRAAVLEKRWGTHARAAPAEPTASPSLPLDHMRRWSEENHRNFRKFPIYRVYRWEG